MDIKTLYDEHILPTYKIRYIAARRLGRQHRFAQWTISFLSVGLILISLWTALPLKSRFGTELLNAMEIFFAAMVLVYSLLLSIENFQARAERMHKCGLELGRLAREAEIYLGLTTTTADEYLMLSNKYYDILQHYENHDYVDFLRDQVERPSDYGLTGNKLWILTARAWLCYWLTFSHYVFIFLVITVFLVLMMSSEF